MSDNSNLEDAELAEVTRMVGEIAREIRQEKDDSHPDVLTSQKDDPALEMPMQQIVDQLDTDDDQFMQAIADATETEDTVVIFDDELSIEEASDEVSKIIQGHSQDHLMEKGVSDDDDDEFEQFLAEYGPDDAADSIQDEIKGEIFVEPEEPTLEEIDFEELSAPAEVDQTEPETSISSNVDMPVSKPKVSDEKATVVLKGLLNKLFNRNGSRIKEADNIADTVAEADTEKETLQNPVLIEENSESEVAVESLSHEDVPPLEGILEDIEQKHDEDAFISEDIALFEDAFFEESLIESDDLLSEENIQGLTFQNEDSGLWSILPLLNATFAMQSPLQNFADFAQELPLHFPMNQFREAALGKKSAFADALAETRSSAANINILLRYAEALLAEQRGDYAESLICFDALGRPAIDNPSIRYDLARIVERSEDFLRAKDEYQTLIGISEEVPMQSVALLKLIELAQRAEDNEAIIPLVRQLSSRVEDNVRVKVLPIFYDIVSKIQHNENRLWLVDALLALPEFQDDLALLNQKVDLSEQLDDSRGQTDILARIVGLTSGEDQIATLQKSLTLYEANSDDTGVDDTLRALWHASDEGSALREGCLNRLHQRHPSDNEILKGLAEFYRQTQNDTVLIEILQKLQDATSENSEIVLILKELMALYDAAKDHDASSSVLLELMKHQAFTLDEIQEYITQSDPEKQKNQYVILLDQARVQGDDAACLMALQGLLSFAEQENDVQQEAEILKALFEYTPPTVESWQRVAKIAHSQDDPTLLREALDALLSIDPSNEENLQGRIDLHITDDELSDAVTLLEKLLSQTSDRLQVIRQMLHIGQDDIDPVRLVELCHEFQELVEYDAIERIMPLSILRRIEPNVEDHLHPLIAHYRNIGDIKSLADCLMDLQAMRTDKVERASVLKEAQLLFVQMSMADRLDETVLLLADISEDACAILLEHAQSRFGTQAQKWYQLLLERAESEQNAAMTLAALKGLLTFSQEKTEQLTYLRAMVPLESHPVDVWKMILERLDQVTDRANWLQAVDQIIATTDDETQLALYLRIRIDMHKADGETDLAVSRLLELSKIAVEPLFVAREIVSIGSDALSLEQRTSLNQGLTLDPDPIVRRRALMALSADFESLDDMLGVIEIRLQLRDMAEDDEAITQENMQISALLPQINLQTALQEKADLIKQLYEEFQHIDEFAENYLTEYLQKIISDSDSDAIYKAVTSALKDDDIWHALVALPTAALGSLIQQTAAMDFSNTLLKRIAIEDIDPTIQRRVLQTLAQQAEATKQWLEAIYYWQSLDSIMKKLGDALSSARVQLRIFGLYRQLEMKAEMLQTVQNIVHLPENVEAKLGVHLIQPFEIYAISYVRNGQNHQALDIFKRAFNLRSQHQKLDYTATTLLGNMAEVYLTVKNYDEAEKHFKQAIALLKQNPNQTEQLQQKKTTFLRRLRVLDSHRELSLLQEKK